MLNCELCMAFTWKTFRARFLRQFLWVSAFRQNPAVDKGPPPAHVSTSVIAKAIAQVEGYLEYQGLMSDAAKCYKSFNEQASAPLDVSSSLSAQEESAGSSAEGEGGEPISSPPIGESSSQRKSVQTTAQIHNTNDGLSQVSSPTQQEKRHTVIQMDTDEVAGVRGTEEPKEKREESSSSGEESSRGVARSENPESLRTQESVESRGRVGGGQSFHGGVHSVANETLLASRASSSSSTARANNSDSTLNRLSRSQFLDPQTRTRASASATRGVDDSPALRDDASQALRDAYQGFFREPSSRGTASRGFGDPSRTSSPMHSFEDFSMDARSIGSRPVTPYADILKGVLRTVGMPDLLVRGLPPPSSPWALLPDEPQDNRSVALALDDHILQELLDAFKAPEPRVKLVEQTSSFRVPQSLYPKFFKAPPLDDQVLSTSNPRGSVPASTVIDHRRVVEGLYEAFMATFRTNWHASVLVRFFFETAQDRISRDVALYLYRAIVEQRSVCLKGAASSIGLIRRQAVETSTLGNWTPLRSRLAPIPFKGGLLFGGEILQQADCLDKEEEQLKKARSFGVRRGFPRSIFRGQPRGGSSSQSPAPRPAPTSSQQPPSNRRGRRARSRSRSRSSSRGRGRSQSSNRSRVSFKEPPHPRR